MPKERRTQQIGQAAVDLLPLALIGLGLYWAASALGLKLPGVPQAAGAGGFEGGAPPGGGAFGMPPEAPIGSRCSPAPKGGLFGLLRPECPAGTLLGVDSYGNEVCCDVSAIPSLPSPEVPETHAPIQQAGQLAGISWSTGQPVYWQPTSEPGVSSFPFEPGVIQPPLSPEAQKTLEEQFPSS